MKSSEQGKPPRKFLSKGFLNVLYESLLILILISFIFPIFNLILTSFKSETIVYQTPPVWIFTPTLTSYVTAFHRSLFIQSFFNSVIISLSTTFIVLAMAVPAAYSFSRFKFRGGDDLAFWILSTRMLPPMAIVIPLYLLMRSLTLVDTQTGLIIVYTALNLPLAVWILRGFFEEIPKEMEEAAFIDGCSPFSAFARVVLPLVTPGLAAIAIFTYIMAWGEFVFAIILTATSARPLTVSIAQLISGENIEWHIMSSMGVIVAVPMFVFALFFQKYIVRGLTLGAVKG